VIRALLRRGSRASLGVIGILVFAKLIRVIRDPRGVQQLIKLLRGSNRLLGARGAARFLCHRFGHALLPKGRLVALAPRNALHPLVCRSGTSDAQVFSQIFLERAYDCVEEYADAQLIVDCGANAGYSTAYFLTACPEADVIAVEPDAENAAMLERNTLAYGARVRVLRSAIWSHPTPLVISDDAYRDGRAWTRQVREADPGDARSFEGVDIGTLLRESSHERISILKIDIEGAEGVVFSSGYESWLPSVDTILIELHNDSLFGDCSAIFHRAIADQGFTVSQSGELTVCTRKQTERRLEQARDRALAD
jgi:FkbM family methyltransferase